MALKPSQFFRRSLKQVFKTLLAKIISFKIPSRGGNSSTEGIQPNVSAKSARSISDGEPAGRTAKGSLMEISPELQNHEHILNDLHQLLCGLADLHDELALEGKDDQISERIRAKLRDKMELSGAELIQCPKWDSSQQRAVKVQEQSLSEIRLIRSLRTGVAYRGKIIRKEEVEISK